MNQTLFQVVLTVLLIGAALIGGKRYIDNALADRPPVVVMDERALIRALPGYPNAAPADVQRLRAQVDASARQLGDAGYVVINRQALFSAPEYLSVKP